MDGIENMRRVNQSHPEYGPVFKDEEALHAYWLHQAHIAAIHHDTMVLWTKFEFDISAERSTAGWIATLDGDAGV
jgi:hypothetical protein